MARRGVKQTELAEAVNIGQSQLSKRLRGKIAFDVDELDNIAAYLDVDPVVFLKPSVTPWPDGPNDDGPGRGPGHRQSRVADLERAARRHRRYDDDPDSHRYAKAA